MVWGCRGIQNKGMIGFENTFHIQRSDVTGRDLLVPVHNFVSVCLHDDNAHGV